MTGHVPETTGHDAENTGHAPPKYAAGPYGAFHTSDVPYALATLGALIDRPLTALDHDLSAQVGSYWLNFMRSGNPNGPGQPIWPALALHSPSMLRLDAHTEAVPMFTAHTFMLVRQYLERGGSATVLG